MSASVTFISGKKENLPTCFDYKGFGVFETLAVERRGAELTAPFLELHLNRIYSGKNAIGSLMPDRAVLTEVIKGACSEFPWNQHKAARLRIISRRDAWIVWLSDFEPPGRSSYTLKSFVGARSLPELKSCSALVSELSSSLAISKGFDEGLLLDDHGAVTESSWGNFFWVDQGRRLVTPGSKCLPGVTRHILLGLAPTLIETIQENCSLAEVISRASEVFISKSTFGIVPVTAIDSATFRSGKITNELSKLYAAARENCPPLLGVPAQ